ncbi:uncharacterized protein N7473_009264 [Penicillium subrubescens]|uniref:Uncharacterized protein n=1 Tax=Penicillium subrubescens TaxID=1316194 RepID=A0A1Q5TAJ1_9EURO|nr:uncharacterized protein N7473_009264 [Penicillium subrubescens]KAJ5886590.1 hypothetical protein N7473_009264 [Penicillium subrubescens]OKO97256.1 hypothetical protein PENSUB_10050 [Penicillium subrubescens]
MVPTAPLAFTDSKGEWMSQNSHGSEQKPLNRLSDVLDDVVQNVNRCRGPKVAQTGGDDVLLGGNGPLLYHQTERSKILEMSIFLQETATKPLKMSE